MERTLGRRFVSPGRSNRCSLAVSVLSYRCFSLSLFFRWRFPWRVLADPLTRRPFSRRLQSRPFASHEGFHWLFVFGRAFGHHEGAFQIRQRTRFDRELYSWTNDCNYLLQGA